MGNCQTAIDIFLCIVAEYSKIVSVNANFLLYLCTVFQKHTSLTTKNTHYGNV